MATENVCHLRLSCLRREESQRVVDVILSHQEDFRLFDTYISEYDRSMSLLEESCRNNEAFAGIVKKFEVKARTDRWEHHQIKAGSAANCHFTCTFWWACTWGWSKTETKIFSSKENNILTVTYLNLGSSFHVWKLCGCVKWAGLGFSWHPQSFHREAFGGPLCPTPLHGLTFSLSC